MEVYAAIAAEVRAEMGRQNKNRSDLAEALGVTVATAGRKFSGETEYGLTELVQVASWLGVSAAQIWAAATSERAAS